MAIAAQDYLETEYKANANITFHSVGMTVVLYSSYHTDDATEDTTA